MPAVQVQTTSTEILAADPDEHRKVVVQNLGPNPIYIAVGGAAATATGLQIAATNGVSPILEIEPGVAVNAIAATANQSTPADTRVQVL